MTEKEIIVGLNSIAAKYGYGKNGNEAFSYGEWNAIERAKEIIHEYETQNKRLRGELSYALKKNRRLPR